MESLPESLKHNKFVRPFINRSIEIESINPVISYYCKIYVLEYILSNKVHITDKEVEKYTVHLLDETEAIKNDEDAGVKKVLEDKTLSLSVVTTFAYKIFNSCLEDIKAFPEDGKKGPLVQKIQACLNFMSLVSMLASGEEGEVDIERATGGTVHDGASFDKMHKEKVKLLKHQLSNLLRQKDTQDRQLEEEFEKELRDMAPSEQADDISEGTDALLIQEGPSAEVTDSGLGNTENNGTTNGSNLSHEENNAGITLPGAPRIPPGAKDGVNLPGVPNFLPDQDITNINGSSSIHVFTPGSSNSNPPTPAPVNAPHRPVRAPSGNAEPLTKADLSTYLDRSDLIAKAQKLAKFAISALNYEDLATAKKELQNALSIIQSLEDNP